MKAHLLFKDRDIDLTADLPPNHEDLVEDLELSTLLRAMAAGDEFLYEVSMRTLLASLDEPETIRYRQEVVADCIAHADVVRQMYAIAVSALQDRRRVWGAYGGSYQTPSSNLSGAISHLEAYVARLKQLRTIADEHAGIFKSAGLRTLLSTLQQDLDDDYFAEIAAHLKQLRFRTGVLISAELDRDNSGIDFVLREPGSPRTPWRVRFGIGARSSYSFMVPPRDDAGFQILEDLSSRGVNLVANAAAQSTDHIKSYFTMLCRELGFYVSCLNLRDRLVDKGVPISFPEPAVHGSSAFSSVDLRDISLALSSEDAVVGNDVDRDRVSLVIITGTNSGGKSTFLRSVGQAQLMMQCGLFVAARAYRAEVASAVFTHFIREEDPSMTSGRLDEELARMSDIADKLSPDALVLFNESFAGTNEREGSEIARQVARALLEANIRVFFVTHRFDFAKSVFDDHTVPALFLRADRTSDAQPNYKLVEKPPLPTSFAEDIYYRLGGWLEEDGDAPNPPSRPPCPADRHPANGFW